MDKAGESTVLNNQNSECQSDSSVDRNDGISDPAIWESNTVDDNKGLSTQDTQCTSVSSNEGDDVISDFENYGSDKEADETDLKTQDSKYTSDSFSEDGDDEIRDPDFFLSESESNDSLTYPVIGSKMGDYCEFKEGQEEECMVAASSDSDNEGVIDSEFLDRTKIQTAVDIILDEKEKDELIQDSDITSSGSSQWGGHCRCLDKEEMLFCEKYPLIYVKKLTDGNKKSITGRTFDIVHACFYCGMLMTNVYTHMINKHGQEERVKEIVQLRRYLKKAESEEKKSPLRNEIRMKQTLIRNEGDNKHNHYVMMKKQGELLVSRRRKGNFSSEDYGPCPECLEWMILKDNYLKHRPNCPKNTQCSTSVAIVQSYIYKGKISENASNKMKSEVFPSMNKDDITGIALHDTLIVAIGEWHFINNMGNKLKRKNYSSYRMRLCARLLQIVRAELQDPLATMSDCLVVENFDTFAKAALLACGTNTDDELKHPSVALKMGYDLMRLVAAKMTLYSKKRDEVNRKEAKRFAYLLEKEWKIKVRKQAKILLEERTFNKQDELPDPQDVAVLAEYLINNLNSLDLAADPGMFRRSIILTEARLILYNRRRPGELEAFSIASYKKRSLGVSESDLSLRDELTEMEKKLLRSQELVEIRGKTGKRVPVLLPVEVKKHLKFLTDSTVRATVGISDKNSYVFASSGHEPVRAGNALDIVKYEANLKYPNRILATNLRKHTATISQVMGLQDHELKWLTNHLGHTAKVHLTHYRATSGLIERLAIAKIMLLQEKNNVGKFSGKKLSEIQFQDLDGETQSLVEDIQDRELNEEVEFLNGTDEADEVPFRGKKKAKTVTRVKWTEDEEKEIKEYFKEFLDGSKKCPRREDCLHAISLSKCSGGQLAKRHWETIKKKVHHMAAKTK